MWTLKNPTEGKTLELLSLTETFNNRNCCEVEAYSQTESQKPAAAAAATEAGLQSTDWASSFWLLSLKSYHHKHKIGFNAGSEQQKEHKQISVCEGGKLLSKGHFSSICSPLTVFACEYFLFCYLIFIQGGVHLTIPSFCICFIAITKAGNPEVWSFNAKGKTMLVHQEIWWGKQMPFSFPFWSCY